MSVSSSKPIIMIVDDDQEDIYLAKRAFKACQQDIELTSVCSGAELFDYLLAEGEYQGIDVQVPSVILLDINMPQLNGFETMAMLKKNPKFADKFAHIPIIMLTTSNATEDIKKAYDTGASAYICKSVNADEMKKITMGICAFWFELVKLPKSD